MKILFFAPSAYLLGGVQDWLADLVPGIRREGHEVTVAVPDGVFHCYESYKKAYPDLACISLRNPTGSQEGRIQCIVNCIVCIQPDLIVGVNIAALYLAVARLRLRGAMVGKLIITLHAIEADYLEDLRQFRAIVDAVVVTNKLTSALVAQESLISNERIFYAPYGVKMSTSKLPLPKSGDLLRLAWVGRFEQTQKRVYDLVSILKWLDRISFPFCLSLAGDGPEATSLQEQLQPWIRSERLRWLGRLDKHQGALKDGQTALLFSVGDCEAAASAIARLLDSNLRTSLTNSALEMVHHRYSDAASLAAWLKVLSLSLELPPLPLDYPEFARFAATVPSGRFDIMLGVTNAEYLRRFLGLNFRHLSAGSEWPHSLNGAGDNCSLLFKATQLETHA
jgi:glycosyltransferase involved in cell wall biosynthesis